MVSCKLLGSSDIGRSVKHLLQITLKIIGFKKLSPCCSSWEEITWRFTNTGFEFLIRMGNIFFIHLYPVKVNRFLHSSRKKFSFLENSNGKDKKMYFDSYGDIMMAVIFYLFLT